MTDMLEEVWIQINLALLEHSEATYFEQRV